MLAVSLGNQARFLGHTRRHYSVAEHLYHCWAVAPQRYKWAALLHDVHEAIVGDVPAPWKCLLPDFCAHEQAWESAAVAAFEIDRDPETLAAVKTIDQAMLATEMRDLVNRTDHDVLQGVGIVPLSVSLFYLQPPRGFNNWGAAWIDVVNRMQTAMLVDDDSTASDSEIPESYQSAGQSFGLLGARRRIDGQIKDAISKSHVTVSP